MRDFTIISSPVTFFNLSSQTHATERLVKVATNNFGDVCTCFIIKQVILELVTAK